MKITVNGDTITSQAATIAALCLELDYNNAQIATALNGNFIPRDDREKTPLKDRDVVEIVAPRQGG